MKQLIMSPAYLFFLAILVFLGCGDALEKETNLLASEELYRFQALPILEDGSLIPLDEVPVVSVEIVTDDPADGFFTWRLKANPVPTREDLVVVVEVKAWRGKESRYVDRLIVVRKNQNSSKEFKAIIPDLGEKFNLSIGIEPQEVMAKYIFCLWALT